MTNNRDVTIGIGCAICSPVPEIGDLLIGRRLGEIERPISHELPRSLRSEFSVPTSDVRLLDSELLSDSGVPIGIRDRSRRATRVAALPRETHAPMTEGAKEWRPHTASTACKRRSIAGFPPPDPSRRRSLRGALQ
jgi:hypothetical protein